MYDEEEKNDDFKMDADDDMLDPLELEDDASMFKFDEPEEDPEDKFH